MERQRGVVPNSYFGTMPLRWKIFGWWDLVLPVLIALAARSFYVNWYHSYLTFETGLYFFGGLGLLLVWGLTWLFRMLRFSRSRRERWLGITFSIFLGLFLLECGLRWMGDLAGYGERNGFPSYYLQSHHLNFSSWYYLHTPDTLLDIPKTEFKWYRETNSLGLSERKVATPKPAGEFRILGLGDSFTEGDGVPFDSTWLMQLEKRLGESHPEHTWRTVNAGIGGSDPVFQTVLLRDKLLDLDADVVILSTNSSDLSDLSTRGGFERFRADGTVFVSDPYAWEWLYGISYTVRFFVRYLLDYSPSLNLDRLHPIEESPRHLLKSFADIRSMLADRETQFLVVVHPLKKDFQSPGYADTGMVQVLQGLKEGGFNYLDMKAGFEKAGIGTPQDVDGLYWPLNRHFNRHGYALYAQLVQDKLEELGWLEQEDETIPD